MGLLETNQQVGNYRIVRKIGAGGMGEVWEAEHIQIGSRAAVKALSPGYSHDPGAADRFFNEARIVTLIDHPSLVKIFDFGTLPNGCLFIVMERLEGEVLSRRIERQHRLGADALRIARQTASALAVAHSKGIIHRDLKPDNLFLIPDPEAAGGERVKILDFGIAKMVRQPAQDRDAPAKTAPDVFMGTPQYMSPEQCRGASNVEEKSDVYSLGIILYEMLSGHLPFPADTPVGELITLHMYGEFTPLAHIDPTITEELSAMVATMLAKQPELRPTMTELVQQLEELGAPKATGAVKRISFGPEHRLDGGALLRLSSTFGAAAGQRPSGRLAEPSVPVLSRAVLLVALGLGVTGFVGAGLFLRYFDPRKPAALTQGNGPGDAGALSRAAIADLSTPSAKIPTADGPLDLAQAGPSVDAAHSEHHVQWKIESEPTGADVVDVAQQIVLGLTPFSQSRAAQAGSVRLSIRKAEYEAEELTLDGEQDASRRVALRPVKVNRPGKRPVPKGWVRDEDGNLLPLPSRHESDDEPDRHGRAD